ncbi:hypothetical protein DL546_006632 [Coniochaeta pulveracea]|uniref:Myb-like domain-containing protein n=1 Tax=Coniochaeta pulveracea TaxID=177199 RepID=A0A420YC29_9PEZI|nr:hypothetical protein DL546_006632 [Coniochaeta pulveracea]
MATIEPRLIHLLNKSPPPDQHQHAGHTSHGSLDLPPIEHGADVHSGEQPSQQQIPPLSSINDGLEVTTSRAADRINDPFSLHLLLEDPEPIRSSQQSTTWVDVVDTDAVDGSAKKRQQDDFIQLPQPPTKKRSNQQLDLPPIIIGLHSPPQDAGMFPPIKCATGPLQDDDFSADNRPRSQAARQAGFYDDMPKLRSRPSKSQSDGHEEERQEAIQAEGNVRRKTKATKKRRPWSADETTALLRGVQRHGKGNWTKILHDPDFSFDRRTPTDLKDRFRSVLPDEVKDLGSQMKAAPEPSIRTAVPLDMLLDFGDDVDGPAKGKADSAKKATESSPDRAKSSARKKTGPRPHRVDSEHLHQDDQEILEGLETYGPQWSLIRDDPRFHLQNRRPTDLRDRMRNKYPDRLRQIQDRQGNLLSRPCSLTNQSNRSGLLKRPGDLLEPPATVAGEQSHFTDKEHKDILKAMRIHGPQWATISNDPAFNISLTSPADLRDHMRTNAEVLEQLSQISVTGRNENPPESWVKPPSRGLRTLPKTYPANSKRSKGAEAMMSNEVLHTQLPPPLSCSSTAEHICSDALRSIPTFDMATDLPSPVSNFDIAIEHSNPITGSADPSRLRHLVDESQPGMSILNAGHLDDSPTNRWFPISSLDSAEQQLDAAKHSSSGHRGPDTSEVGVQSHHRLEKSESPTSRLLALPCQDHGSSSAAEVTVPPVLWKPSDTLESNDPSGAEQQAPRRSVRRDFVWN